LSTLSRSRTAEKGFTLIEALVALAIVAASLASIGALIATTARGTRSIEQRLFRLEAAHAAMAALPDRDQLAPAGVSGELDGHRWRLEVAPFVDAAVNPRDLWLPQTVVIAVQSPGRGMLEIPTVRLRRRSGG
jgi:general secretion pathway protein I